MAAETTDPLVEALEEVLALSRQRDLLADAAHRLAMLGLQSERYARDPEYRDAVDNALSLAAPSGEEAPNG